METDGGASYVGYQSDYAYDYASHFPMFGGNLGMLGNLEPKTASTAEDSQCAGTAGDGDECDATLMSIDHHIKSVYAPEAARLRQHSDTAVASKRTKEEEWIPAKEKKKSKATEEINRALHEAMRYKPVIINNRFAAIEAPEEANTTPRSSLGKNTSMKRQLRTRFADMTFDEFGEPIGQPCRSSCGCWGACALKNSLRTVPGRLSRPQGPAQAAISPIFLATVDVSPELLLKVKNIKAKCDNERKEAVANRLAGSETKALLAEMMGAVNHGGKPESSWNAWQKLSIAIDSGAAATVIPHTMVTEYPIVATAMSEAGVCYVSATGEPIPNLGEQRLPLATIEGSLRAMTFQAAPVAKPLGSMKKMCQAGHVVVFDDEGSYIYNKNTQEINWLREES